MEITLRTNIQRGKDEETHDFREWEVALKSKRLYRQVEESQGDAETGAGRRGMSQNYTRGSRRLEHD